MISDGLYVYSREYWRICRGPGFLAFVWFGSSLNPLPPLPSVSSTEGTEEDWERETARRRERGMGWGRSQSFDGKKAWSSINHSIFSGLKAYFWRMSQLFCWPINNSLISRRLHVDCNFVLIKKITERVLYILASAVCITATHVRNKVANFI
jgi:hypothetical protein